MGPEITNIPPHAEISNKIAQPVRLSRPVRRKMERDAAKQVASERKLANTLAVAESKGRLNYVVANLLKGKK